MDITEIQKDKKVILRPFDNGRRLKVVFQDLKDASKHIAADLSRDTVFQLSAILHCKEIEKLLEKQSKKET